MSAVAAPSLAERARAGIGRAIATGLVQPPQVAGRPGARSRPAAQPRPVERTKPDLRALPQPTRLYRGIRMAIILMALTAVVIGVLGVVALNAVAAEASFEARTLERDIAELTLRHDDLVAEVAMLAGPARVSEVATMSLGMMAPEAPGFLTIDPSDMPAPPRKPLRPLGYTTIGG